MQFLRSTQELGELAANIGSLVLANAARRGSAPAFAERNGRNYRCVSWARLGADLGRIAAWLSALPGADDGDGRRVAFIAGNGYVRHVCELAVMASGRVSVPIFAGYPAPLMAELLRFAAVELLVTDQPDKVLALDPEDHGGAAVRIASNTRATRGAAPMNQAQSFASQYWLA